jgi:hypothetical protein
MSNSRRASKEEGRPYRALRQFNNRKRERWGEPPLPEPEHGYAEEVRPKDAQLVEEWFRAATSRQPHRKRKAIIPASDHIDRIAKLVRDWRELRVRSPHPATTIRAREYQQLRLTIAQTSATLDMVLKPLEAADAINDPFIGKIVEYREHTKLIAQHIGPPRKQGPQRRAWQVIARALAERIRPALASMGVKRIGDNADSPLVEIIVRALESIDGVSREPATVSAFLRRHSDKSRSQ